MQRLDNWDMIYHACRFYCMKKYVFSKSSIYTRRINPLPKEKGEGYFFVSGSISKSFVQNIASSYHGNGSAYSSSFLIEN